MRFEPEFDSDDPRGNLQRLLLPWLSHPSTEPLEDWLQGYGLPPVGHDEEPYIWLLRGLPRGKGRHDAEQELSSQLARVLQREPDRHRPGRRPEQMLYNLLMLCAGLSTSTELAEPLDAMFQREVLAGHWQGHDVRDALLLALIHNQPDARWGPVWSQLLAGGHPFLPGGPYDGFRGILRMPPPGGQPGEPALEAIGQALRQMGDYLSERHYSDRRPRFRELLSWVEQTYPSTRRPRDLLELADRQHWPEWMVTCLPTLCIDLGPAPEGRRHFLLWTMIARFLPHPGRQSWPKIARILRRPATQPKLEQELCGGVVEQIQIPGPWVKEVKEIAGAMEKARMVAPYPSDSALSG
jgi:hypothetical protein